MTRRWNCADCAEHSAPCSPEHDQPDLDAERAAAAAAAAHPDWTAAIDAFLSASPRPTSEPF